MRSPSRPCTLLLAPALAFGLLLTAVTAAPAARAPAEPVVLSPASLPAGAPVAVPHVEGTTVVDGATRIAVPGATRVQLLGRSGAAYVAASFDDQGRQRVVRATPAGSSGTVRTLLTPSRRGDVVTLSTDGRRLAQSAPLRRFTASRVRVWDAGTGERLAGRTFPGVTSVLDLDAARVVLAQTRDSSTRSWATGTGAVSLVAPQLGYRADLAADRLATFDGDPFAGGCTVVSRLSRPQARLWRSCNERVETFSPGGRRMATVDLLSDGIGPSQVLVRGPGGASKAAYRVRGYFGELLWESGRTLLLETSRRRQTATVRCIDGACERASALRPTPAMREPARARRVGWRS